MERFSHPFQLPLDGGDPAQSAWFGFTHSKVFTATTRSTTTMTTEEEGSKQVPLLVDFCCRPVLTPDPTAAQKSVY